MKLFCSLRFLLFLQQYCWDLGQSPLFNCQGFLRAPSSLSNRAPIRQNGTFTNTYLKDLQQPQVQFVSMTLRDSWKQIMVGTLVSFARIDYFSYFLVYRNLDQSSVDIFMPPRWSRDFRELIKFWVILSFLDNFFIKFLWFKSEKMKKNANASKHNWT